MTTSWYHIQQDYLQFCVISFLKLTFKNDFLFVLLGFKLYNNVNVMWQLFQISLMEEDLQ